MLSFRGCVSASLVYDDVPVEDVFRRVDEDTVLGLMNLKGLAQPFFFLLERALQGPEHSDLAGPRRRERPRNAGESA